MAAAERVPGLGPGVVGDPGSPPPPPPQHGGADRPMEGTVRGTVTSRTETDPAGEPVSEAYRAGEEPSGRKAWGCCSTPGQEYSHVSWPARVLRPCWSD